jgi:predicted ATPase/class 3 adenylate cyclase
MDLLGAYLPTDRRHALARGETLPDRTRGAALFADVSGFTPLTEALLNELGPRRGAEELTRQLNLVYAALIAEVDRFGGSVITFGGDAITCWFEEKEEAGSKTEEEPSSSLLPPSSARLRAIACALAMQIAMKQFAAVTTPSGQTVTLAMKAAVAAGPARRFIVGDPGIQLMDALAGATLQRMAEAEHHARRGEVVASEEAVTPEMLVAEWRAGEARGQRFAVVGGLTREVDAAPWPAPTAHLPESILRTWLLQAVFERAREGQDDFLAELRPAHVLFMRFGGIDYDADPEAGDKLDRFIRWAQGLLDKDIYKGTLLQIIIGDKGSYIYAAFGAPNAHDDDADRMTAAALELRRAPQALPFVDSVQLGLSQGRMRVGPYGGPSRRTYGMLGDVVNLAARLMARAEPGEILASQAVAAVVQQRYQLEELGPVQLKGKTGAVAAFRIVGERQFSRQRSLAFFTHPLVGRDAELQKLSSALEALLAGRGQLLRLEGGVGLGKSHLAAEFTHRASQRGVSVAVGDCHSTRQESAYSPWRQIFRSLISDFGLQILDWDDPNLDQPSAVSQLQSAIGTNPSWLIRLPLLGDLLGLDLPDNATTAAFDPRLRQEALFALAVDMLREWAARRPLLILLEDVHWMDEASLGLALALGRVAAQFPVLLMVVHRPPAQADALILPELNRLPNYHELLLDELSLSGIAELVSHRLAGPIAPLALALIHARAQGNPFFTEELVGNLREAQRLQRRADGQWNLADALVGALRDANCLIKDADGHWQLAPAASLSAVALELPDSVQGMVLARMDRLPEQHKSTLKVASVIGRAFGFDVLRTAHPAHPAPDHLQDQLTTLEQRDFTRLEAPPPQLAYTFKHNATQEVAYDTLLEAQQRELHRAVGNVLERFQPEAVEQLAYHFVRGGPEARDKALVYLDKAARKAQREYANETALSYYAQALALEGRWEWRKGQVEILHILGRREDEQAALRALETDTTAPAFEAAYLWGKYHEAVGDYAAAQAAVERALAAGLSPARGLPQLGLIARRQGNYEGAKARYHEALDVLQDERPEARIETLNGLSIVHRQQGHFDEARVCAQQALTLSQASGNRRGEGEALNGLGATAFYQRKFAEATSYHEQALKLRREIGDRAGEGSSLYNLAIAVGEAGDNAKALDYFHATLALQQAIGNRWEEVNAWNGLGVVNLQLGNLEQAEECSRQGLRLAQEIGDEAGQAYILGNLGQVMRDQGKLDEAIHVFTEGLALVEKQADKYQMAYLLSHLALVQLKAGQPALARERAEAALALRRELDLRLWTTADLAILASAHQALGDSEQALGYAHESLTLLNECKGEGPEFPHQDYFLCAQVLGAQGLPEAARAALHSAREMMLKRAERISDLGLRRAFLARAPMNRAISDALRA